MFAAESYTSRHYIAIVAMACLCVLLGGPSYAAGAESLIIAGATYYEPGVSGPGWAWTDADHLELNGYAGEAIGAEGDLVLTLAGGAFGASSVVDASGAVAPHVVVEPDVATPPAGGGPMDATCWAIARTSLPLM